MGAVSAAAQKGILRGVEDSWLGACHNQGMGFQHLELQNILSNLDDVVNIYWSQLVLRPLCVDRLEITIGEQLPLVFLDPADEQMTAEKISIGQTCDGNQVAVKLENFRGGYDVHVSLGPF